MRRHDAWRKIRMFHPVAAGISLKDAGPLSSPRRYCFVRLQPHYQQPGPDTSTWYQTSGQRARVRTCMSRKQCQNTLCIASTYRIYILQFVNAIITTYLLISREPHSIRRAVDESPPLFRPNCIATLVSDLPMPTACSILSGRPR